MSLINQMLKDIDVRKQSAENNTEVLVQGLAAPKHLSRRKHSYHLGFMYMLLGVSIVTMAWLVLQKNGNIQSADISFSPDNQYRETDVLPAVIQEKVELPSPARIPEQPASPAEGKSTANKLAMLDTSHTNEDIGQKPNVSPTIHKQIPQADPGTKLTGSNTVKHTAKLVKRQQQQSEEPSVNKTFHPMTSHELAELSYRHGLSLIKTGQLDKAENELRQTLVQLPEHNKAREMLAGLLIKQGKKNQAMDVLAEGFAANPHQITINKLYARLLIESGNNETALKVLEEGKPPMAQDPEYYAFLAAVYQRANRNTQASALYSRLVALSPNQGIWWLGLGVTLESQGRFGDAMEAFQRAKKTGQLKADLQQFIDSRIAALKIMKLDSAA